MIFLEELGRRKIYFLATFDCIFHILAPWEI